MFAAIMGLSTSTVVTWTILRTLASKQRGTYSRPLGGNHRKSDSLLKIRPIPMPVQLVMPARYHGAVLAFAASLDLPEQIGGVRTQSARHSNKLWHIESTFARFIL